MIGLLLLPSILATVKPSSTTSNDLMTDQTVVQRLRQRFSTLFNSTFLRRLAEINMALFLLGDTFPHLASRLTRVTYVGA